MAEAPIRHRKNRIPPDLDPTDDCCSNSAGPSHSPDQNTGSKPTGGSRRRRRQCVVPTTLELTRVPLLTSSSGQVEGGVRHYSLSSEDGELAVQTLDGPGDTVGGRRPDGGAVVDLTNDSGVEDEDVVDLTSPIRLPVIVPEHEFLHERPNCFHANPRGSAQHQCTVSPEVVIVQESDDEIQVISSTRGSIAEMSSPKKAKHSSHSSPMPVPEPALPASTKSTLTCPVCMDTAQQFETGGRKLVTTVCGHVFCNSCIRNAIQRQHKCPTCRKKLSLKQYHELFVS